MDNNDNRFYVYIYLDQTKPGYWKYKDYEFLYEPFYVGKGTRKRDITHLCPFMLKRKNSKNSKIKSIIQKTGELPLHFRIYDNLTDLEASIIEQDIISFFGRKDLKTGFLTNLTNGGDGSGKEELVLGRKPIYQYSLSGLFLKKWENLASAEIALNVDLTNVATAIKRNGTCYNFIWSFDFLGEKINSKIKYQMPIKYKNIKQIDKTTGLVLNVFEHVRDIEEKLSLRKGAGGKIIDCINGKLKTAYKFVWKI